MSKNKAVALLVAGSALLVIGYLAGHAGRRPIGKRPGGAAEVVPSASTAPAAETPLAPVQLDPRRLQTIGVTTGPVREQDVTQELRIPGTIVVDEKGLAAVQLRFSGWVRKVFASTTFQYVRKGEPLFTIYSPDLVTTEREYLLALKNRDALGSDASAEARSDAAALADAARQRLALWQIPGREIKRLEKTGRVRDSLAVDSPVSGYITERNVLPNMFIEPQTRLYMVADLSTVWVNAQVFQNEIADVHPGDRGVLTVDSYPGRRFVGRVDFIWPEVDVATRTVKARLVFPNPHLELKPGMFVTVTLHLPLGRHLVVPTTAVFQTGTRQIVFVDRGEGSFEPRQVETGAAAGDDVVVKSGLTAGEIVATSANFLIDSESQLQAALGSFVPPPPGAGAAAAMNPPTSSVEIDFTTDPSLPVKGSNLFRVQLMKDGQPAAGAQVEVTFAMPAMPAMGMAAMQRAFMLMEKGNGIYEGQGELPAGGNWRVVIVVRRGGRAIATRQLTLDAGGGT